MKRTEFERCTPESVGIRSEAVSRFLDRMTDGFTEMHSLMIMRHGKICGEGWWAPYAPGLRHTMMSQSKTYTGTAIGIALREGILSLDKRLVDIFPEYVPEDPGENLKKITIHHLLCMGSGMGEDAVVDRGWLKNYFAAPVLHEPGTDFYYNDTAVTVLPAIIRKKTGMHILEYLKPRLFDKIGIDADNLTWFNVGDGCAFGAGGLYCTTEDTLRLMKLYADGGVWKGERILDKEYVRAATSCQNSTKAPAHMDRLPLDNQYGYGYLMWMGHVPGTFRAEGAFGQITLVDPRRDMIISFTESARTTPASQESMDRVWEFLEDVDPEVHILPEDREASDSLRRRFRSLALEQAPYAPFGKFPYEGRMYQVKGDGVHPENLFHCQLYISPDTEFITGITSFSFSRPRSGIIEMNAVINGRKECLKIAADGGRRLNILPEYNVSQVYLSGYWKEEDAFAVRFRWIETVHEKELTFRFEGEKCSITEEGVVGRFPSLGGCDRGISKSAIITLFTRHIIFNGTSKKGIIQEELMCGRYYVDDETAREIEKLTRQVDKKLRQDSMAAVKKITEKDICPTQLAPVLAGEGSCVYCGWQRWGFPGFQGKQVIFNARCESAMEKPLFRDSIRHNRVVIPATWFYEWNRRKEKNIFYRGDTPILFMAGCCRQYEDGARFVILTTGANDSMKPVHDRMPLILEEKEIAPWILDNGKAADILHKTPCLLKRRSDYEQLTLF